MGRRGGLINFLSLKRGGLLKREVLVERGAKSRIYGMLVLVKS